MAAVLILFPVSWWCDEIYDEMSFPSVSMVMRMKANQMKSDKQVHDVGNKIVVVSFLSMTTLTQEEYRNEGCENVLL